MVPANGIVVNCSTCTGGNAGIHHFGCVSGSEDVGGTGASVVWALRNHAF